MTVHQDIEADAITVRVGTPEDVHGVMQVALMAVQENGFAEVDPELLLGDIWSALNLNRGIMGVIGEPGEPVEGVVLLRIGTMWYSSKTRVLEERAIFVHPDYRSAKGGRAAKLCKFSKSVSDTLGIPLTIGILSSLRTEGKVRMYRRILGEPSGAYWLYNAKTGQPVEPTLSND